MLHGFVIVIKRTGQDGSKFPVTQTVVKIGTSHDCPILITTPFVTGHHCQLIVQDDGQVKIQNFSTTNPTVVNQTVLEDTVLLNHGDVIEVGGRLVRFEYPKDSPHYREPVPREDVANDEEVNEEASKPDCSSAADLPTTDSEQLESSNAADLPTSSAQLESSNLASLPTAAEHFLPNTPESTKKMVRLTPQTMRILTGRKSLQLTKSIVSQTNNRRKNDAIRALNDEDLTKIVAINGKPILRTPVKSSASKAVGSPFVDQIKKDWIIQSPAVDDIGVDFLSSSSTEVACEPAEESSRMSFLLTSSDDKIPSTPSTSKSTTPEKCLIREKPSMPLVTETPPEVKTPEERLSLNETPPEVKTPESPPKTVKQSSPITPRPITRILANDTFETPPEVITPESLSPFKKPRLSPIKTHSTPGRKGAVKTPVKVVVETPSPKKTPRVTPSPRKALRATPSPKKAVQVTPSPRKALRVTPSPKKTPRVSPSPKKTPRVSPSPKKTPLVTPSSKKELWGTPKLAPTPKRTTRMTPSPVQAPVITPSPKRTAKMSPATPAFKTPMSVRKGDATPVKSLKKSPLIKTPTPAKRGKSQGSTKKQRASPRSDKAEKTPSPKHITKKAESGSGKKVSQLVRRKSRVSAINARVAKAFGIKSKIISKPDKHKAKALLVLGKAVNSKSQTQMKIHKKLVQKAIKIKNQPKRNEQKAPSPKKNSPVKPTPKKKTPGKLVPTPGVRASSRISSKNVSVRPDYTELSPSVLGLAPRFNTPVVKSPAKRKSKDGSFLTTPRKNIVSIASTPQSTHFILTSVAEDELPPAFFTTPKKGNTSINLMEFYTPAAEKMSTPRTPRDSVKRNKPSTPEKSMRSISSEMSPEGSTSKSPAKSPLRSKKSPANRSFVVAGVQELFKRKSPRNDLTNIPSLRQIMKTPQPKRVKKATVARPQKSPKNDLTNIPSIRRIMKTPQPKRVKKPSVPQPQKSPKNDLTHIPSIRRLMKTPQPKRVKKATVARPQKSPKNDLTNIPSIRRIMKTPPQSKRVKKPTVPRPQKSPKNDLTHIPSIRTLMKTPPQPKRVRKPTVPRPQKSPKNDLTHIPSIRTLMKTPPQPKRVRKPTVPRPQKSPKNDLTHIPSIRKLMKTPPQSKRVKKPTVPQSQKSPKNDLTDVTGVKEMFLVKEPKTPFVRGVKRILARSPRNDLRNVSGLNEFFVSPVQQEVVISTPVPVKRTRGVVGTPKLVDTPLRRGRSSIATPQPRASKTRKNTITEPDDAEVVEAAAPGRGRRKAAPKPSSPPKRGKKGTKAAAKLDSPLQQGTINEDNSPSPPKRARGTSKTAAKARDNSLENKSPSPPKRGRKAGKAAVKKESPVKQDTVNEDSSPSPPKRGRNAGKAAAKRESLVKQDTVNEDRSPSPPKRGRKTAKSTAKAEVQDESIEKKTPPKRGRKAATASASKTPTLRTRSRRVVEQVEEISAENVEKKPAKGKGRPTKAKVAAASPSPSPKKRITRARTQTATRSTRGGAAK